MKYSKGLLLTNGVQGMISQAEGLAKALNLDFKHYFVNLKKPWKYFPINFVPVQKFVIQGEIPENTDDEILISCGKNGIIPSLFLKKNNKNLLNIHIQNPAVSLSNFDLVIAPEHDHISGSNVISTFGSLHYVTQEEIKNVNNYFSKYNFFKNEKIVTIILGGPNRYYNFTKIELLKIFYDLKENFLDKNYKLIIIKSRRTPNDIITFAKNYFLDTAIVVDKVNKEAYFSALKISNILIVTSDSTSMISECAVTEKPIFVAKLNPISQNKKFNFFLDSFRQKGIIRFLGEKVDNWSYPVLNETNRVANIIKQRFN